MAKLGKVVNSVVVTDQVAKENVQAPVEWIGSGVSIMDDADLGSFYSIKPTTNEGKIALYNAINTPDKRLADMINLDILMKDVLIELVELENENGETVVCPRIIIIDVDGVSYQCVSIGIMSGLKRIFKLFGPPTWETPVKVKVMQITKKINSMLSLKVI